jgi:hypothetical protein
LWFGQLKANADQASRLTCAYDTAPRSDPPATQGGGHAHHDRQTGPRPTPARHTHRPAGLAPFGLGTLRTDTPTFVVFLIGFAVIFAVLTFLSVLVLAPFPQALSSQMLG